MRFLILGTGYIGPINTKALMACEGVEIAGVCNRTLKKAETMCRTLGLSCPVYSDWKQALDEVKPDAAVINVFNDLHKEYFMECAERGIHILVEKPLANTHEDCLEMKDAAEKHGIRVSVLQTQRYGSVLATAKEYIRKHREELGELVSIQDSLSCHYFWQGRSPWHLDDRRSGGGILLNYGVHQLDRIHWLMEEPTVCFHASCQKKKEGVETVSSYTMMGVSAGGITYTVSCHGYCDPGINELTLNFTDATLRLVLEGTSLTEKGVYVGVSDGFTAVPLICEDGQGMHEMYVREMRDAVSYLEGRTSLPPVSLDWAAEMVRLCCLGFRKELTLGELLEKTRSIRRFDPAVRIPEETLTELVSFTRLCPSGGNFQPLRYMCVSDSGTCGKIFSCLRWAARLGGWQPTEKEQPAAYVLVLIDKEIAGNAPYDSGIAAHTILMAAAQKGIGGCMLGNVKRKEVSSLMGIDPDRYAIDLVIALGKPAETSVIDEYDGDSCYYRDGQETFHVPKLKTSSLIL